MVIHYVATMWLADEVDVNYLFVYIRIGRISPWVFP